ncbi:MAG: sensor histidine kinase [Nitrospirota bacterium]
MIGRPEAPATTGRVGASAGSRPRIVLASDDAETREALRRVLAAAHDVSAVSDEGAALAAARAEQPDLVVSDLMPTGVDGLGLLRALRAEPITRAIPVILLCAQGDEDAAAEGLEAGADDALVKPVAARELSARVRARIAFGALRRQWALDLDRVTQELDAFSYAVSHDLRAPLRAIEGFSDAVLTEYAAAVDEQGRRYLDRIRAGTQRMSALIEALAALSRVSRVDLHREPIDLASMARRVLGTLQRREPSRAVRADIPLQLPATGDQRLLAVALEHLIGNAWKFTARRADAAIFVGREPGGTETVFFVRDNGVGFDMAYADKLFVPFQRLHKADEFEGVGIGLAVVQRIMSRHGGRVWATGAVNEGTTVYFTLGGDR